MLHPASDQDNPKPLEYSVVYSDRSLNHMSKTFCKTINQIQIDLTEIYGCHEAIIVPGSGTFAMEAVCRQFCQDVSTVIIRNGWFSYRWSQILETAGITDQTQVLYTEFDKELNRPTFSPPPIRKVLQAIYNHQPRVFLTTHVETSTGVMLPDDYIRDIATAVHDVGGMLVVDSIASGAMWLDMATLGIDVLITVPQKGWSSAPGFGAALMSDRAMLKMEESESDSFACNLKKWHQVIEAYQQGKHAYYTTMPTEAIYQFGQTVAEARQYGLAELKAAQTQMGELLRVQLNISGFPCVAAAGYEAPSVIVSYTDNDDIKSGQRFLDAGVQIAPGVPLMCGEPADFKTFRVGLFGLDKLYQPTQTVDVFREALTQLSQT